MTSAEDVAREQLVAFQETIHIASTSTPKTTSRRYLRANRILAVIIPFALAVLAYKGYHLVVYETATYIELVLRKPRLASLYRNQFRFFFIVLLFNYTIVYFTPNPTPVREPPPQVKAKKVPFECTEKGEPVRCYLDDCNGAWRSIRTRHCRDSGVCQPGFDHFCAFMSNCINARTMKPFFLFLVTVIPLIGFAIIPLIPLQFLAMRAVIQTTWSTPTLRSLWLSKWYSWIGGPIFHYGVGLILAYRQYFTEERPFLFDLTRPVRFTQGGNLYEFDQSLCPSLDSPSLSGLLIVTAGAFVFFVAIAMILTILLNGRRGLSSVQVSRIRAHRNFQADKNNKSAYDPRIFLWVPLFASDASLGGGIVRLDPSENLFDFGPKENLKLLLGKHFWQWFLPWMPSRIDDFTFNEAVLETLRTRVKKCN